MSNEKICPFMSNGSTFVNCIGETCIGWGEKTEIRYECTSKSNVCPAEKGSLLCQHFPTGSKADPPCKSWGSLKKITGYCKRIE